MNFEIDKDVALLYGILLGDGCLCLVNGKNKFIGITGSLEHDLPFFQEVIAPILRKYRGKETPVKFRKIGNTIDFNFTDCKLFDFIHSLGFPIGKKGVDLVIHSIFYEKDLIRYVAQGFFATDGSLVLTKNRNKIYPRLESHAICKNILKQLYDYFISIGMKGSFYQSKSKPNPKWRTFQDSYKFQFNGKNNLLIFRDKIGFVNPYYEYRFDVFMNYSDEYDSVISHLSPRSVASISQRINEKFIERMALGRIELPVPAS